MRAKVRRTRIRNYSPNLATSGSEWATFMLGYIDSNSRRLRGNLPLPKSTTPRPKYSQADANTEQLRSSLTELCMIVEFVNNPMHKEARVFDANLSVQASADLEKIVRLSNQIRKSAELLRRAAKKSR